MGRYAIRRILQMIPVVLGTTFIIYASVFALGDPTVGRCGERPCPPAYIEAFNAEYNLDKPLIVQYVLYLGKLVQGDLGTSFYGNSVATELAIRFPTTMKLTAIAIFFEAVIGITAGIAALALGTIALGVNGSPVWWVMLASTLVLLRREVGP